MGLQKLVDIRKEKKFTFQKVADKTGLSKEHYWMIENGKRSLSYENAVKIASCFDLRPDDIFWPIKLGNDSLEKDVRENES